MIKNVLPKSFLKHKVNDVIILAPGPSLSFQQLDIIKKSGMFTIAIGDAGRVSYPDADVIYHAEKKWWNYYYGLPEYKGLKLSMDSTDYDDVYQCPASTKLEGVDLEWPLLVTGYNSGYQAINLSLHFGATNVLLVGYDLKKAANGAYNVIGDHPKSIKRPYDFKLYAEMIDTLAKPLAQLGVKVYNCTIDSSLTGFERKDLAHVISDIRTRN